MICQKMPFKDFADFYGQFINILEIIRALNGFEVALFDNHSVPFDSGKMVNLLQKKLYNSHFQKYPTKEKVIKLIIH